MANKLGISIEVNFQDIGVVDNKLKNLLKKLEEKNKLNLSIDTNTFAKIEKEFNQLKDKISKTISVGIDNNNVSESINNIEKAMNNIDKKQIKFIDGKEVQTIEQARKSLIETNKVITDLASGKKTQIVDFDYTKNFKEAEKNLDSIYKLQNQMAGAGEKTKEALMSEVAILENKNKELYRQLDLQQLIDLKTKESINVNKLGAKKEDTQQNLLYKEASNTLKEIYDTKIKIIKTDEEDLGTIEILTNKLNQLNNRQSKTIGDISSLDNLIKLKKQETESEYELDAIKSKSAFKNAEEEKSIQKQIELTKELMETKLKNLQTKYGSLVNTDEVENFKKSLDGITTTNFNKSEISNEFGKIEAKVKASSNALNLARKDAESFGNVLKHDLQMFSLWMITGSIVMQGFNFFKNGISYINDLNKSLTEISIVTGKSQSQVRELGFEYANLAKQMSVSTQEIASASVEFYRQGLSQADVMERMKTTTEYAKISNLDFKQSAEILTATVNSMGVSVEKASDVFAFLGDATASGADEIGIAMSKVAGTANVAGVSLEKMSSWIATISSKTRESAETVGFSMQSILSRYMQIKENGFNEEDSTKLNDVVKALTSIGVTATDSKGQLLPFSEVLDSLATRFSSLDRNAQGYILTTLAGTRQSSRLANLLNSYGQSIELYNGALQSANSTTQKYNLWLEGTEAHLNQLKLAGTNIWQQVFNSNDIKAGIDLLTGLLNTVGWVTKTFGGIPTLIGAVTFAMSMMNKSMSIDTIKKYVTALLSLPMAYREAKAEGLGLSSALQALGISLDVAKIKAIAFQTVMSFGLSLVITGIISGLSKLYNSFINTEKIISEQKQKVDELSQSYNTLQSEIQNLKEVKNPTEEQKEYLKTLERELELKKQLLDVEKRKLMDKEVFGKGVWGKGMSGDISSNIDDASYEIEQLQALKVDIAKAIEIGDAELVETLTSQETEYKDNLKGLELKLIENKKVLEDYAKTATGKSKEDIEKLIASINGALPQITAVNVATVTNTKAQKDNTTATEKTIDAYQDLSSTMKTLSEDISKAKSDISDINKALEEYAKNGKFSTDTILDMSSKYPELLNMIGRDAEISEYLNKVKSDQVGIVTANLDKQIKANADYVNGLASQYGIDVQNMKSSEEAKSRIVQQGMQQRLQMARNELNATRQQYEYLMKYGTDEQREALGRRLYSMGADIGFQIRDIQNVSTAIDAYFKLIDAKGNIVGGLNNYGTGGSSAEDTAKKAEDLRNQMKSDVKDIETQITDIIKKEFDERKKAIEDEYNTRKETLQKAKDLYNKQNNEDDYNKKLKTEQDKLNGIKSSIASTRDTTSEAGKLRLRMLQEQEKEQQQVIDDMVLEHQRSLNNDMFDAQMSELDKEKEAKQKALEEQYSEENISKMVNQAMITGQITGIGNVLDAYLDFQNKYNQGLTASGKLTEDEFINRWKEIQSLINGTSGVDIGVDFKVLPRYANGGVVEHTGLAYVDGTKSDPELMVNGKQAVNILRNFAINPFNFTPKIPNISGIKSRIASVNFNEPFVVIQGNVDKSVDLEGIVNKATDNVTRKIMQTFNNYAIYEH